MKMVEIAVKRPVATIIIAVGFILLGIISVKNLNIDLLPNLSYPKLSVITEYSGATPEEVEKLITIELEAAFSNISGMKRVTSISREGISLVNLEFHWGTDMNFALLHTKEKVEEVNDRLPKEMTAKPRIIEWDPTSKPIVIAVLKAKEWHRGQSLAELRETAEFLIKPRLEQLEGIAKVDIQGSGEREVVITIMPEKMILYNIDFSQIENTVKSWNQSIMGGTVKKDKIRYVIKVEGEIKDISEIEKIPVRNLSSGSVLIKDIADVRFSEKIKQGEIRFNNRPTIGLMIYREASGNTVSASKTVRKTFKEMEKEFPEFSFDIVSEEAGLIMSAISNLQGALIQGAIFAFLVLLIFFQNLRDPILVAIISPISVLATFILMYFSGVNLNIMSLGGLALGIGIFMDNAIVVIENMYRLSHEKSAQEACIKGTIELIPALVGSSLTTIVIFLPVIYIYGVSGRLFRDQSLTISFALVAAFLLTITLLPTLFRIFSEKKSKILQTVKMGESDEGKKCLKWTHFTLTVPFRIVGFILETIFWFIIKAFNVLIKIISKVFDPLLQISYRIFNKSYDKFAHWYHGFLVRCLDKKSIAGWISVIMIIGTIVSYLFLKKELLPQTMTKRFEVSITTNSMMGYEETEKTADDIEEKIKQLKGIKNVFGKIGTTSRLGNESTEISVNRIDLIIECESKHLRDPLIEQTRQLLSLMAISQIDNYSVFPEQNTLSQYLQFGSNEFQIKVFYETLKDGQQVVEEIKNRIKKIPQLVDIRSNTEPGKPILAIRFNEELLKRLRVSKAEIVRQISIALRGTTISTLREFQKTYDIIVSSPIRDNRKLDEVMKMKIKAGINFLTLNQLVSFEQIPSIKELTRDGQERLFTISANLQKGKVAEVSQKVEKVLKSMSIPAGVRYVIAGEEGERKIAFRSVSWALILSVILVYMVMAAEFENLIHPIIIMSTIPMGMFGAFVALLITGDTINVISGIGMMVAVGIVVDDAIVKIDCANSLRHEGMGVRESLMGASRLRLKPIILNTFTTVFGVLPMIYMSGVGAELQKPMAVVVAGSLLSSTFLTLILIPVLYEMFTKEKKKTMV